MSAGRLHTAICLFVSWTEILPLTRQNPNYIFQKPYVFYRPLTNSCPSNVSCVTSKPEFEVPDQLQKCKATLVSKRLDTRKIILQASRQRKEGRWSACVETLLICSSFLQRASFSYATAHFQTLHKSLRVSFTTQYVNTSIHFLRL